MKFSQPVMIAGSALFCIISMLMSADGESTGENSAAANRVHTFIADASDPETPPEFMGSAPLLRPSAKTQIPTSPRDVSSRLVNEQIRQRLSGENQSLRSSVFEEGSLPSPTLNSSGPSFFLPEQPVNQTGLNVGPTQRSFYRGQAFNGQPLNRSQDNSSTQFDRPPVDSNPPPYPNDGGFGRQPSPNDRTQFGSNRQDDLRRQYESESPLEQSDNRWSGDGASAGGQDYYPEDSRGDTSRARGNDPFLPPNSQANGNEDNAERYDGSLSDDTPVTPPVSAYDQPSLNLDGSTSGEYNGATINSGILPSQIITTDTLPAPSIGSVPVPLPQPMITRSRDPLGLFSNQGDLFRAEPLLSGGAVAVHPGDCACGHCSKCTTCTTTCQPLCLTKTILVPEWYTVYSTVNETHYRPRIKEEPYFIEQKVTHQVPVIETFPVIVKEPRIRNSKTYRKEEYQVPREVEYTVMVPKPKTRQVTSERKESYEVPEEEQYTVMVPKEKEVRKTKYKTVMDKEPIHKEYVVMVPQTRTRVKIDYETRKRTYVRKIPFTKTVERELVRQVVKYRSAVRQVRVNEEYYEYEAEERIRNVQKLDVLQGTIDGAEEYLDYIDRPSEVKDTIQVQRRQKKTVQQSYTVTVPYKEEIEEVFWENEAYEETADRPYEVKTIVGRDVTRPYIVKLPYVEHVPQVYTIRVPYETTETRYREVPRQMPVTKFQMVKRDMGRWVTDTVSLQTYEEGQDLCGCPTCCPKARTIRKTKWVPNIVSRKLPYTTYKTVKQKVPYQAPVMKYRQEQRQRMIEVTKFRTEVRQAVEKKYSFETSTKQKSYPVTKFRLVRKTRAKSVTNYREETRTKNVSVNEYVNETEERKTPFAFREVDKKTRPIKIPATKVVPRGEEEKFTVMIPKVRTRQVTKNVTVRVPEMVEESYTVKVPVIDYREVNETEEYEVEVPRKVTYTVNVPEIRTKTEYIEVERRVPYVEITKVTEMVPEIKTRRVYKTRSRTVSDVRVETFMTAEPEVMTKTVYDTLYKDVPVFKSELYWENVTKVLKKTVLKPVSRTIKRPAIRRHKVMEPYNVKVKVPRRAVRMVPRQITIPVEACCEECCTEFTDLTDACGAYISYGLHHVRRWINGL